MRIKSISIIVLGLIILYSFILPKEGNPKNDVNLHRIISSECNNELDPFLLRNRIISKTLYGDSLFLNLGLKANCCIDFNPTISYTGNIIEVELDTSTGEKLFCACNCCYELTLVITGIQDTSFQVKIEDEILPLTHHHYETYPIQFELYKGDTINRRNIYGFKEGIWLKFDDASGAIKNKFYYAGIAFESNPKWREKYNSNGFLESRTERDTTWEYYSNGNILSKSVRHKLTKPHLSIWLEKTTYDMNGNITSVCLPKNFKTSNLNAPLDSCTIYTNENPK